MALILNEEQQLLKDSVSSFFRDSAPVTQLRALRDSADETGYDTDLWAAALDLGIPGLMVSEDDGGVDFGLVAAGIVAEESAHTLAASPFLASSVAAVSALKATSGDTAKPYLAAIAAGEKIGTLAVDEGARHAPDRVQVKADDAGNLTGLKTFVPDGHVADFIIVTAKAPDASIGLYLVERKAEGLIVDRTVMQDSRNWAKVTLSNTPSIRLEFSNQNSALDAILDPVRVVAAAELLGIADECLAVTTAYLKERTQFGVTIGSFQALQHRAAHLFSEIEVARSAVLAALQAGEAGAPEFPVLASLAKGKASQVAELATNEAIQMHGGIGMTDEYDIGFYIKRARVMQAYLGDHGFHADRFARLKGY